MQQRNEMRAVLQGDEYQSLINTWNEYSDDQPLPTRKKTDLIEAILDIMQEQGEIKQEEFFKLPDLAREMGINPKIARDKYRKALSKSKDVPGSLKPTGWVFAAESKQIVADIIKPRRKT